jgi:hypothetical protein
MLPRLHYLTLALLLTCRSQPTPGDPRAIGTADPIAVSWVARSGRTLVACQARRDTDGKDGIKVSIGTDSLEGDAMVPYLFRGGGPGQPIDAVVAASADGRWLAMLRDDQLILVDDASATERTLRGADLRSEFHGVHYLASFAGNTRLVYLRASGDTRAVVIRDLMGQRERSVAFTDGLVLRVEPGTGGPWARLVWLPPGARDAVLHGPGPDGAAARGQACGGDSRYRRFGVDPVAARNAWLNLDTGEVRNDPSVVGYLDELAIVKAADGTIRVGGEDIIPSRCDAEIAMASRAPLRLIATCATTAPRAPVEMFGPAFHVVLGDNTQQRDQIRTIQRVDTPFACIGATRCYALRDGREIAVRGLVQLTTGTKILTRIRDAAQVFVTDAATGTTHLLPGVSGSPLYRAGTIVTIGHALVYIADEHVLGVVPGYLVAVDASGRALVAEPPSPERGDLPLGPLRWATPAPAKPAP